MSEYLFLSYLKGQLCSSAIKVSCASPTQLFAVYYTSSSAERIRGMVQPWGAALSMSAQFQSNLLRSDLHNNQVDWQIFLLASELLK